MQAPNEICRLWNRIAATGRLKDMAAAPGRTLLLKLDRRGLIHLPARAVLVLEMALIKGSVHFPFVV